MRREYTYLIVGAAIGYLIARNQSGSWFSWLNG